MGKLFWDALKSRWCGFGAFFDASALDIVFVHFLRRCKIVSVDCRLVSRVLNLKKSNFCSKALAWTNSLTYASPIRSPKIDLPKQISPNRSSQTNLLKVIPSNGSPQMDLPKWISPKGSPQTDLLKRISSNGSPKRVSSNGSPPTDLSERISSKGSPQMDLPKRISQNGPSQMDLTKRIYQNNL